ncbi:MAG: hypothetical protein ABSA62_05320 [Methyloceanibacter sp.]
MPDSLQERAEFGLDRETFKTRLGDVGGELVVVKRQLEQGHLPRGQFEPEFKELITLVSDDLPVDVAAAGGAAPAAEVAKVGDTGELTLISDRSGYKVNNQPIFTIRSKTDCNLTLIDVDGNGEGVVIFPNKSSRTTCCLPGRRLSSLVLMHPLSSASGIPEPRR